MAHPRLRSLAIHLTCLMAAVLFAACSGDDDSTSVFGAPGTRGNDEQPTPNGGLVTSVVRFRSSDKFIGTSRIQGSVKLPAPIADGTAVQLIVSRDFDSQATAFGGSTLAYVSGGDVVRYEVPDIIGGTYQVGLEVSLNGTISNFGANYAGFYDGTVENPVFEDSGNIADIVLENGEILTADFGIAVIPSDG